MKKSAFLVLPVFTASLVFGYYRETGEAEMYTHIFIKKYPTLQIGFENIFANLRDAKSLSELTHEERHQVMDYCKYRLGTETRLQTQSELDECMD